MRPHRWIMHGLITLALTATLASPAAVLGQEEIELKLPANEPGANLTPVQSVAFSPDGKLMATAHGMFLSLLQKPDPGQTVLWDAAEGRRLKTIPALEDGARSVAFSPDGKTLAAGSQVQTYAFHNIGTANRYPSNGVQYARDIERADASDPTCQWMQGKIV